MFFRPIVRTGRKCDLSDLVRGMIVGARQGGLRTADLLGFSCKIVYRVFREWGEKQKTCSEQQFCRQKCIDNERDQRRRARLVKTDRKVTVTQITTHYNSGMEKSISELCASNLDCLLQQQKTNKLKKV